MAGKLKCSLAHCELVWRGIEYCMIQHGMLIGHSMEWYSVVWHGVLRYNMVWNGMVHYGIVWYSKV